MALSEVARELTQAGRILWYSQYSYRYMSLCTQPSVIKPQIERLHVRIHPPTIPPVITVQPELLLKLLKTHADC